MSENITASYDARKKPSAHAELAARLYRYLVDSNKFTAPYGILEGWHIPENKRGKARTITFGFARTLDATLFVWSATYLLLKTNREEEKFTSEQAFYDYCAAHYGTPWVLCAEAHMGAPRDKCEACHGTRGGIPAKRGGMRKK